jgi:hypothetical protein
VRYSYVKKWRKKREVRVRRSMIHKKDMYPGYGREMRELGFCPGSSNNNTYAPWPA